MVNIWLIYGYYMVNNNLVGGAISPSWKMMEFVNGKDDIPYMKWKIKNVWNHQAVFSCCLGVSVVQIPSKSWRSTMVWCLLLLSQPAVPSDHSDYSNVSSYTVNVDRKLVGFLWGPQGLCRVMSRKPHILPPWSGWPYVVRRVHWIFHLAHCSAIVGCDCNGWNMVKPWSLTE